MSSNQQPGNSLERKFYDLAPRETTEVYRNIWRIVPPEPACNVYLIRDTLKTVLIDTGLYDTFDYVAGELENLGVKVEDVDLVINTHEHFDHIGGNPFLYKTALVAASRNAATKIELQDEYVTHLESRKHRGEEFAVHIWMENRMLIWTGDYKLKILHTPGHTSGSICIYDPFERFMFTGDTVVHGEYLTPMLESGSAGDFVNSIERLLTMKVNLMLPGHGPESHDPEADMDWANQAARQAMDDFRRRQSGGGKRRIKVSAG